MLIYIYVALKYILYAYERGIQTIEMDIICISVEGQTNICIYPIQVWTSLMSDT